MAIAQLTAGSRSRRPVRPEEWSDDAVACSSAAMRNALSDFDALRRPKSEQLELSGHGARHEAPDFHAIKRTAAPVINRPNHRSTNFVRFSDQCLGGYIPPFVPDANAIVTILALPIRVQHDTAVGIGATRTFAAGELFKPWLERRVGITSVRIASERRFKDQQGEGKGGAASYPRNHLFPFNSSGSRKLKRTASARNANPNEGALEPGH